MNWDLFFLLPAAVIGGISAVTDIRHGKIKNWLILLGFIFSSLLYTGLLVNYLFLYKDAPSVKLLFEMILNGAIAFTAGYIMWQGRLWAAGDAKLFALYAFLIPVSFYSKNYLDYFPSAIFLINTFLIVVFFLLAEFLYFSGKNLIGGKIHFKNSLENLREEIKNSVKNYLNYVAIFFIIRLLLPALKMPIVTEIIVFFATSYLYRRFLSAKINANKKLLIPTGLATLCYGAYLIFQGRISYLVLALASSFFAMVLIGLISRTVTMHFEKRGIKKIKIAELEKNMIVSETTIKYMEKTFGDKISEAGLSHYYPDGLTARQVKIWKELIKNPDAEVEVCKTFPFAPFMFAAFLVTLALKGSIISFLMNFF